MEMTELRSKEEVKQDIEATRRETNRSLREAKTAWVTENPAVIAWQNTRAKAQQAKTNVTLRARLTDCRVRSNIYSLLGIAAGVGIVVGFIASRRQKQVRYKAMIEDCCC